MSVELEQAVVDYLERFNFTYTKTLYKALRVKDRYEMSMNKFRNMLYCLLNQSKIDLTEINGLPCWRKKHEY